VKKVLDRVLVEFFKISVGFKQVLSGHFKRPEWGAAGLFFLLCCGVPPKFIMLVTGAGGGQI